MMNKNLKSALLGSAIILAACNTNSDTVSNNINNESIKEFETVALPANAAVNPMFKELDIPYQKFGISTTSDTTLTFGDLDTKISIPANCFVFEDGSQVDGDVEIDFREIRSAAEIILSGITMKYDSAGTNYDFQTAGMFDIRGYKNGQPIKFAPGKSIEVKFDSNEDEGSYNFYCLDEEKANWDYLSTPKVKIEKPEVDQEAINKKVEQAKKDLANLPELNNDSLKKATVPVKPQLAVKDQELWDLEYDYVNYPQFKHLTGVMWQYCGDSASNPLKLRKGTEWKPVSIISVDDAEGIFNVTLKTDVKKITMQMRAVYMGEHYKFARSKFNEKLTAYKNAVKKADEERQALIASINPNYWANMNRQIRTPAVRTMNISGFGVFNCDRYYRVPAVRDLVARVDSIQEIKEGKRPKIFLVAAESTVVINVSGLIRSQNFRYSAAEDNKLVMLFPNKKIATFSAEEFDKIQVNKLNSLSNPYVFEMTMHKDTLSSPEDLDQILKSI